MLWQAKQDRTGMQDSPVLEGDNLPDDKDWCDIVIDDKTDEGVATYLNEVQTIEIVVYGGYTAGPTMEPIHQAEFRGGVLLPGPGGVPGVRKLRVPLVTVSGRLQKMQVRTITAGVVYFGIPITFGDD